MATRFEDDWAARAAEAPAALLRDPNLSRTRKIAILTDWALELADRELADREDGIARDPAQVRADAAMLTAVNDALDRLGADAAPPRPRPLRWFARLIGL